MSQRLTLFFPFSQGRGVVTNSHHQSFVNRRVLRINVGYLLAQGAGYQRVIELDLPRVQLAEDAELDFLKGREKLAGYDVFSLLQYDK